jgi:hypothetical protein
MNKHNAAQFLPLVQALADGKTIQKICNDTWEDLESPFFHDEPERYRIKQEPREFWLCRCSSEMKHIALPVPPKGFWNEIIRVREILD